MIERELVITELWKRLSGISGVNYTARNPSSPPSAALLPAIQIFELSDRVLKASNRGSTTHPVYTREVTVAVEGFIRATTEEESSKEIATFVKLIKKAVYAGGVTLGGKCQQFVETESSRILRPKTGEKIVGMGLVFTILYIEDVSKNFS